MKAKHPKNRITDAYNDLPERFNGPFCCPMFEELTKTGEIAMMLPPHKFILNMLTYEGKARWHRTAFCPFCGAEHP